MLRQLLSSNDVMMMSCDHHLSFSLSLPVPVPVRPSACLSQFPVCLSVGLRVRVRVRVCLSLGGCLALTDDRSPWCVAARCLPLTTAVIAVHSTGTV